MKFRLSPTARLGAFCCVAVALAAPAVAQSIPPPLPPTTPGLPAGPGAPSAPSQPATAPIFGYPYSPGTADLPEPSAAPAADASAAPNPTATIVDPAASGAPATGAPQVDPTSQAPNTYGGGNGQPPRLRISSPHRDDSATMRIAGSLPPHATIVSLSALGLYRHDPVNALAATGRRVAYSGVALQFLPGVSALVHPALGDGASLVALAPATIVVVGRNGTRATFASRELIDRDGDPRVFLIDSRMGLPLGAGEGPFRLIAPKDKNPSRWIEDVVEIDVNR